MLLSRPQKYIVMAVTFGNLLEWYDVYLYVFWAPTISKLFFRDVSSLNLFNAIALFALGFIFRPLGGLFFGRLGDRLGRKKAFILSIILMAIPTFLLGILPVYSQIGIFAPIILALSRILQIFPAGGELPGAFCYLYENANWDNRKLMTSFAGVGNQLGIIISATECFLLETYLPPDLLVNWGWRISFIMGGLIGMFGFYLRYKLHETRLFQEEIIHHKIARKSLFTVLGIYWKKILLGISYGAAQTVSFHFISILIPLYFYVAYKISESQKLIGLLVLFFITTVSLPFFGFFSDKFGMKKLLIGASLVMLGLLYPLYYAAHADSIMPLLWVLGPFVLCLAALTELWPYLISALFPTSVRYTCVGISFNLADGVFGGFSTVASFYILNATSNPGSFVWILLVCLFISIFSFFKYKSF